MSQSTKKQAKRHAQIEAANPAVELSPCLGKVRYLSEDDAKEKATFRPYYCGWCEGYHTSAHGFKGARRGR